MSALLPVDEFCLIANLMMAMVFRDSFYLVEVYENMGGSLRFSLFLLVVFGYLCHSLLDDISSGAKLCFDSELNYFYVSSIPNFTAKCGRH